MSKDFENQKWDCKWFFRELFYILHRTSKTKDESKLKQILSGFELETKIKRLYSFITAMEDSWYNENRIYETVVNYLDSFGFTGKNRKRFNNYSIDSPIIGKIKKLYNDNGSDFIYDKEIRNSNALLENQEVDENLKECLRENLEKIKQDPDRAIPGYLQQMFEVLSEARLELENVLHLHSGVMCGNRGGYSAIFLVSDIVIHPLKKKLAIIDEILALLIFADKADISFSTQELVEKYHFPTITDGKIEEWKIDNF